MSNERPITAVMFHRTITLGTTPHDNWFAGKPSASNMADKVTVRPGNRDLGENPTSLVFEVRLGGKDGYDDVEVPVSNLAEVHRGPPETKPAVPPAKK